MILIIRIRIANVVEIRSALLRISKCEQLIMKFSFNVLKSLENCHERVSN